MEFFWDDAVHNPGWVWWQGTTRRAIPSPAGDDPQATLEELLEAAKSDPLFTWQGDPADISVIGPNR